jgi:hypothetical protein
MIPTTSPLSDTSAESSASGLSNRMLIEPQLHKSPLEGAAAPPFAACCLTFTPFLNQPVLVAIRAHYLYKYVVALFAIYCFISLPFFDYQNNHWYNMMYSVPLILIVVCDLASAQKGLCSLSLFQVDVC